MALTVDHDLAGPFERIGPGLVPRHFVAVVRDDLPVDVTVEVEARDGSLRCVSFHAVPRDDGPALTGEALRKVPIEQLMRTAAGAAAVTPVGKTVDGVFLAAPARATAAREVASAATGPRGRRRGTTVETAELARRIGDLDEQFRQLGEKQPIKQIRRILENEGHFFSRSHISALAAKERQRRGGSR